MIRQRRPHAGTRPAGRPATRQRIMPMLIAVFAGLVLIGIGTGMTSIPAPGGGDRVLDVALWLASSSPIVDQGVQAAANIWADQWGRKSGAFDEVRTSTITDLSHLAGDAEAKSAWDMLVVPAEEFLRDERSHGLSADYALVRGRACGEVYVLLVRRGAGIDTLEDLADRDLLVPAMYGARNGEVWLDGLLAEAGRPPAEEFARVARTALGGRRLVLPLCSGQADACVVSRSEYETMAELNPRISRSVQVLATSPRLIPIIFSVSPGLSEPERNALHDTLVNLHEDSDFKQLMMLYRVDGLAPIDREGLESTRAIYDHYHHATNPAPGQHDHRTGFEGAHTP